MTTHQPPTSLEDTTSAVESHEQADAAVSVEGIARPIPREQTAALDGSKDSGAAPVVQHTYDYRQLAHPSWPTSKPGPEITPPPLGQHPLPGRTDQMIYGNYDQVRGMQEATGNRPRVYRNEKKLP